MSDSVQPHRWQPTRLPRPWDSQGKNTGVGCHFLLQCMKVKNESEVAQSCPILSDPVDCSPPGSSIHGIFQARVPEWGAIAFSSVFAIERESFVSKHKNDLNQISLQNSQNPKRYTRQQILVPITSASRTLCKYLWLIHTLQIHVCLKYGNVQKEILTLD